eukprot:gene17296-8512_t
MCPDEDTGCPYTAWVLCAFEATNSTIDQRIHFLTCFDEASGEPKAKTT